MSTTVNYKLWEKNPSSHGFSRFQLVFFFLLNPAEKTPSILGCGRLVSELPRIKPRNTFKLSQSVSLKNLVKGIYMARLKKK